MCFLLFVVSLYGATPLLAGTDQGGNSTELIRQKLAVNRTLLTRFENEYRDLKSEAATKHSPVLRHKLEGARYKIQAVKDDLCRLESLLPAKTKAAELMNDLLCQQGSEASRDAGASSKMTATAPSLSPPSPTASAPKALAAKTRRQLFKTPAFSAAQNAGKLTGLHERALILVSRSEFKEAEALYQEILLINPDDDQAYIILGHIYLLSGEYEKAETSFHNAISIDPANINDITPFYESLIVRNPSDDMAYAHLGYAYLMLDRVSEAKQAFRDALQINPNNYSARNGLGVLGMPH